MASRIQTGAPGDGAPPLSVRPLNARQRQARETRQKIFDAAVSLFREKGFDYVTVDEIVERAKTAKGTFYTHFATKSDIVIEEFREIDDYYERALRRLEKLPNAREKLVRFTRGQCRYIKNRMSVATLKVLYANQVGFTATERFLVNPQRKLCTIVRGFIAEGQERGEFRTDIGADELTGWLNRSMRGMFLDWAVVDGEFDLISEGTRYFERFVLPTLMRAAAPA